MVPARRPEARPRLEHVELLDPGHDGDGALENAVQAARRDGRVVPALLARRADDEAAVSFRNEVRVGPADRHAEAHGVGLAQRQHLALDRPDGRRHDPGEARRPRASREHNHASLQPLAGLQHDRRTLRVRLDRRDGCLMTDRATGHADSRGERLDERTVVDLVVRGRPHGGRNPGREQRLALPRRLAREPLDRRAVRRLEVEQPAQPKQAVAVIGHDERPLGSEPDGEAGRGFQLRREGGPPGQALAAEGVEVELLEPELHRRREHAGRRPRRAAAGRAAVQHSHGVPALREAPRDAEAGHAGADDENVGGHLLVSSVSASRPAGYDLPAPLSRSGMRPVVVVGAGLAGACAALELARTRPVVVLDAHGPASGASGAAAGLVNPFAGRRGARAWRADEARAALDTVADTAGVSIETSGVLRPASSPKQAADFVRSAGAWPEEATFIDKAHDRWPDVEAPLGALWIPRGGHTDVARLVQRILAAAERLGAAVQTGVRLTGWTERLGVVNAITDSNVISAEALVLCPGDGVAALPGLSHLAWGRVKGQTVTLGARLPDGLPAVAGGVYIVPSASGVVVGATFEHRFETLDADPEASAVLRARAARLIPALAQAPILSARAGVRLTVPERVSPDRLPRLEAVSARVWVFAGLGSRGLLTAPLLARAFSQPPWRAAGIV